ncbi:GSCFA domain-containing protein [Chitinophaga flava]|uniref:GSCFA domain-containing protein n=1 Tax=Chitinophaga flava TaxID=2259036 RepID=A0A365XSR0_9BACT|nr:GSCFA domain-containing protein [Chitinophaga flava]RBL89407.1 GSCFA domain-containing protein [Chitinophaga flava]
MQFHLSFPVDTIEPGIHYSDKILLMGSCFAEEIGAKLHEHRFNTLINPHGILFNPLSLTRAITSYLDGKIYTKDDLFQHQDTWHSWDHHSRFSGLTPEATLEQINAAQQEAIRNIEQVDWLVLTLGSAHAYFLKEGNQLVGNCHKVPGASFHKRLLTVEEVVSALDNVMHRLFFRNRKLNILFTVSPVRYIRDGVVENNLSKAVLLQAVHHMVNKFARLWYFPAYELVIDDLRDYRFYKDDMVHPNETAVNYVWEHVVKAAVHGSSQPLLHTIAEVNRAAQHRPFNPESSQHQQFLRTYADKVKQLMQAHPHLYWEDLLHHFKVE